MELLTAPNQPNPEENNHVTTGTSTKLRHLVETIDQADRIHETGNMCRVIVAELETGEAAIKVPRTAAAKNRLLREALVLSLAQENEATSPLVTPKIIDLQETGTQYIAYYYVPGNQLDRAEIQRLSVEERCNIGRTVVDFALWLNESVPLDEYPELGKPLYATSMGDRRLMQLRANTLTRRWTSDARREWPALEQATSMTLDASTLLLHAPATAMLGHGDLRADNMLFTEDAGRISLHGVIDFGMAEPSYMEYELQHLAQWGPEVVAAAVEQFKARTGTILDEELLVWWSRVQCLAVIGYRWQHDLPLSPSAERAFEYLFPDLDYNDGTSIPTGVI